MADPLMEREDLGDLSLRGMIRDFYNRRMLPIVLVVWVYALVFLAIAVYCAVFFFRADDTRSQILWAAVFLCSIQFFAIMKIFAWQMIHRNSIHRAIRRLERRVEELSR